MVLNIYRLDTKKLKVFTLSLILAALILPQVQADVLFEGYYQIQSADKRIGYTIQRYSFDKKSKTFSSTYFIKTQVGESTITESLNAEANDKFQPLSYQYTAQVNEQVKTIDAQFKGTQMTAIVSDGKNKQTLTKTFPKGTFLSSFLGYLMLQNGYKTGKKFNYKAIAEEDGEAFAGEAWIKDERKIKGIQAFRIFNKFKGANFISFVTPQAEVLGTNSPLQKISTSLVATPAEATQGQILATQPLRILFGRVPLGRKNILAQQQNPPTPKESAKMSSEKKNSEKESAGEKIIAPLKSSDKQQNKGK